MSAWSIPSISLSQEPGVDNYIRQSNIYLKGCVDLLRMFTHQWVIFFLRGKFSRLVSTAILFNGTYTNNYDEHAEHSSNYSLFLLLSLLGLVLLEQPSVPIVLTIATLHLALEGATWEYLTSLGKIFGSMEWTGTHHMRRKICL